MPTDHAAETVVIAAPMERVLATIRDIESQPSWVKEIIEAEVLEEFDDGTPATAHVRATAPVGTDDYTLSYEHAADGMSWSLVKGRLQTGQDATYSLRSLGKNETEVTFDLTIHHNLPLPGFLRGRVIRGLVHSTVKGLKEYVEA
ncbi:MAG TPA: SRPBCC family protein [Dermatophilaceae bacterium]|nr:SRPBCC family protein [Dermatophilaceae bacterium]